MNRYLYNGDNAFSIDGFMKFLSRSRGTGGSIKNAPEDFIVKEITSNGIVLDESVKYTAMTLGENEDNDSKFTRFVFRKRDWDTVGALVAIAKRLGRGRKSIGYAGTKDKISVSVQLASIFGVSPEQVLGAKVKDIEINGAWKGGEVELGSNIGNGFHIKVKNPTDRYAAEGTIEELKGMFPNYFDKQRFGYRLNNFRVGMHILGNRPEDAMDVFVTDTTNENNAEAMEARKRLAGEQDFKAALQYFPKHLKYERTVIDYMARYDNPANALRRLPRGILLLFIHAVESGIFNSVLEKRIDDADIETDLRCASNFYGFPDTEKIATDQKQGFATAPIIGYETKPEHMSDYEKDTMESLGISCDAFKIKSMPELSMKGTYRTLLAPAKNLSCDAGEMELCLKFEIPSGSYATVLANEITKADAQDMGRIIGTGL